MAHVLFVCRQTGPCIKGGMGRTKRKVNYAGYVGEGLCSSRLGRIQSSIHRRQGPHPSRFAPCHRSQRGRFLRLREEQSPSPTTIYESFGYTPRGPGPQPRSFQGVRGFQRGEGDRRRARPVGEEASRSVGTAKKPAGDYCGSRMDRNPPRPFGLSGARSPAHSAGSYLLSKDQSSIFNLQSAAGGDLIRHILRRATLPKGEGLVVYHGRDRKKALPVWGGQI